MSDPVDDLVETARRHADQIKEAIDKSDLSQEQKRALRFRFRASFAIGHLIGEGIRSLGGAFVGAAVLWLYGSHWESTLKAAFLCGVFGTRAFGWMIRAFTRAVLNRDGDDVL